MKIAERGKNRRGVEFVKYETPKEIKREKINAIDISITLFVGKFLQITITGGPKNGAFYLENIKQEEQVNEAAIAAKYEEICK